MKPLVIKLGGVIIDTPEALDNLFMTIQEYKKQHQRPIVIVHGGGCLVDELMNKLSMPVVRRNGLRVTPKEQIDLITGSLAGSANKKLLSVAIKHHLSVIGLCLADGHTVLVEQISDELGHVGDVLPGETALLTLLLDNHYLPIISSIGITHDGELMNVNADHAAVGIAKSIDADLVLLSDVSGVLDENKQCISVLTKELSDKLIEQGVINGGMVVKVNAAFDAANKLNHSIDIASWKECDKLIALFNGQPTGTRILPNNH